MFADAEIGDIIVRRADSGCRSKAIWGILGNTAEDTAHRSQERATSLGPETEAMSGRAMDIRLHIESKSLPLREIRESLEATSEWSDSGVTLTLQSKLRSDPAVLVAIISVAGTGLTALVAGLLQMVKRRAEQKIVLEGKHCRLEIPADTPKEEIDRLIEKVEQLGCDKILLP